MGRSDNIKKLFVVFCNNWQFYDFRDSPAIRGEDKGKSCAVTNRATFRL